MNKWTVWLCALGCAFGVQADEAPVLIRFEDALLMALDSDERIEIQRRESEIAGYEVNRAWAIVSPRVSASGQYSRPEEAILRGDSVVVPEDSWRGSVTARQPLFDGRVLSARRVGLAREESEIRLLAHYIQFTLFDVARAYYHVLSVNDRVTVAGQTLELAGQEVARARARYDAGEARRTEVLRAEVDESRAVRNLVASQNEYEIAMSDLARRIGLTGDHAFRLEPPPAAPEPDSFDRLQLVALALEGRQDLAAARSQMKSRREEHTVIRREAWPTLELQYTHQFVDPESFTTRNNFWDVAAVARMEFWDGGSRRISRRQQEQRIEQAALRISEMERMIEQEVRQALLELDTLVKNLTTLQKEVDLAEENYRTLSEQAQVGLATSLDVSTALTALAQARTELAQQEFDVEVAKQRVDAVAGRFAAGLIQIEEPQ